MSSELERLQAEIARMKEATAPVEAIAPSVPEPPVPAIPEIVQEPAAQALQDSAAQAVPDPVAAASAAADAILESAAQAQAPIQAIQDSAEPMATATIPMGQLYPLLVFLGLSIIPLGLSVAKALNPELFAVSEADEQAQRRTPDSLYGGGQRNAKEMFFTGLENLKKEPTGWLFGKPSALYSNEAPPPPPPPPTPTFTAPPAPAPMPVATPPPPPMAQAEAVSAPTAAPDPPAESVVSDATPEDRMAQAAQAAQSTEGGEAGKSNRFEKRRKAAKKKKKGKGKK